MSEYVAIPMKKGKLLHTGFHRHIWEKGYNDYICVICHRTWGNVKKMQMMGEQNDSRNI